MSAPDDERLSDLAAALHHDDPRFARALEKGRPTAPREYRRLRGWCWLAVATAALVTGVFLPHGLLLATGLVLAGLAAQLFDPHLFRGRRGDGGGGGARRLFGK
ncbi:MULTISPECIES: DUF3040 domain-containing protein [unclassified Streptomyces]|uniref:DUF3040 domain-containing protein n=1 Tax=unclassified Streptomyces TaxID=2593676 RepID=UPI00380786B1